MPRKTFYYILPTTRKSVDIDSILSLRHKALRHSVLAKSTNDRACATVLYPFVSLSSFVCKVWPTYCG